VLIFPSEAKITGIKNGGRIRGWKMAKKLIIGENFSLGYSFIFFPLKSPNPNILTKKKGNISLMPLHHVTLRIKKPVACVSERTIPT
jgi:hypothetical protein